MMVVKAAIRNTCRITVHLNSAIVSRRIFPDQRQNLSRWREKLSANELMGNTATIVNYMPYRSSKLITDKSPFPRDILRLQRFATNFQACTLSDVLDASPQNSTLTTQGYSKELSMQSTVATSVMMLSL